MAALIKKVWWYRPNEFTTTFTLTATFADGTTSVYTFNKSGLSWVATGSHDNRLLIVVPTEGNNTFRVRVFENDIFVSLEATYANDESSSQARTVQLKRIVFPKEEYDRESLFYQLSNFPGNTSVWSIFKEGTLGDIFITNLTETIKLPNDLKSARGSWVGWGLYNETVPKDKMRPRAFEAGLYEVMYIPVSDCFLTTDRTFPDINKEQLKSILTSPSINNRYLMLPLYMSGGVSITWNVDRTDYRNE